MVDMLGYIVLEDPWTEQKDCLYLAFKNSTYATLTPQGFNLLFPRNRGCSFLEFFSGLGRD